MQPIILWSGNGAGVLGILCCLIAGASRMVGAYHTLGGLESGTFFMLGTGLMVYACLTKLHLIQTQAVNT